jgi:hypothetical protein
MITKYQRHPTDGACVILHVSGVLSTFATSDDGTLMVENQEYRDALETASADNTHTFFGKLED